VYDNKCCYQICGGDKPYLIPSMLSSEHERCRQAAKQLFLSTRKMGGPEFSQEYLSQLEAELEGSYDNFLRHNAAKNVFAGLRTPGVLVAVIIVLYLTAGVLGTLGLESLANVVNTAMLCTVATLAFWSYSRFTGKYTEIASQIDTIAAALQTVWAKIISYVILFSYWCLLDISTLSCLFICQYDCLHRFLFVLVHYFHFGDKLSFIIKVIMCYILLGIYGGINDKNMSPQQLTPFFRLTWVSWYQNVSILDFIGAKDDGDGGNNWSHKTSEVPVKSSPRTNQYPTAVH